MFINNCFEHIHGRYISHDCDFQDINQLIFFFDFLRCGEKVHNKNLVTEIQNLIVNHESRTVKLSPVDYILLEPMSYRCHSNALSFALTSPLHTLLGKLTLFVIIHI